MEAVGFLIVVFIVGLALRLSQLEARRKKQKKDGIWRDMD